MTLLYKVGDLVVAAKANEINVIAHQANCQNVMGSGIAPLIKEAFPDAWKADCEATESLTPEEKLGAFSVGEGDWPLDLLIFNLYGQLGYGRGLDTDYDALRSALSGMELELSCSMDQGDCQIGLPKIGAGLGGGDWSVIEEIIEEELTNLGWNVTIYVLDQDEIPAGGLIV